MKAFNNASLCILAVVCIIAIVFITTVVLDQKVTVSTADSVGSAYAAIGTPSSGFDVTKTSTEPCAYAYLRDNSKC